MFALIINPMPREITIYVFNLKEKKIIFDIKINDIMQYNNKLMFNALINKIIKIGNEEVKKEDIKYIIYRVLFGGEIKEEIVEISEKILKKLENMINYNPLHLSITLETIKIFNKFLNNINHFISIETSFFTEIPDENKFYAIPFELSKSYDFKRFGFHGIFHRYSSKIVNKNSKIISLCLDDKITICGIKNESPLLISYGLTPQEGIMGLYNTGDIDPGIIFYLIKQCGFTRQEVDGIIKNYSGFYGITGKKESYTYFLNKYGQNKYITLSFDILKYQITIYLGKYFSILNGISDLIICGKYAKILYPFIYILLKNINFIGINLKQPDFNFIKNDIYNLSSNDSLINVFLNNKPLAQIIGENLIYHLNYKN